ncbi:F0F1 ATP synthase subunit delta [bacterium]|nr:F0F1 ATP synthase subunit delta [bacterium]
MRLDSLSIGAAYARAAWRRWEKSDVAFEARSWFAEVGTVCHSVEGFLTALDHPSLSTEEKGALLSSLCDAMGANEDFLRTLQLIVLNGKAMHLPAIASAYGEIADRAEGIRRGFLETERPLDKALVRVFGKRLGVQLGLKILLTPIEGKGMMGGFRLTLGKEMVDASVESSLNRIETALIGE